MLSVLTVRKDRKSRQLPDTRGHLYGGRMMAVASCALGAGVTSPERMVFIAGTRAINAVEFLKRVTDL